MVNPLDFFEFALFGLWGGLLEWLFMWAIFRVGYGIEGVMSKLGKFKWNSGSIGRAKVQESKPTKIFNREIWETLGLRVSLTKPLFSWASTAFLSVLAQLKEGLELGSGLQVYMYVFLSFFRNHYGTVMYA